MLTREQIGFYFLHYIIRLKRSILVIVSGIEARRGSGGCAARGAAGGGADNSERDLRPSLLNINILFI